MGRSGPVSAFGVDDPLFQPASHRPDGTLPRSGRDPAMRANSSNLLKDRRGSRPSLPRDDRKDHEPSGIDGEGGVLAGMASCRPTLARTHRRRNCRASYCKARLRASTGPELGQSRGITADWFFAPVTGRAAAQSARTTRRAARNASSMPMALVSITVASAARSMLGASLASRATRSARMAASVMSGSPCAP